MENLLEYAQAGGTDYEATFMAGSYTSTLIDTDTTVEVLEKVRQGFFDYTVRVTTDTAPLEYNTDQFNNRELIRFGGSESKAVLIDASVNKYNLPGTEPDISDFDEDAYEVFKGLNQDWVAAKITEEAEKAAIAAAMGVPYTPQTYSETSMSEIMNKVDRELVIETVNLGSNEMQLKASFEYEADSSLQLLGDRTQSYTFYSSEIYGTVANTDESMKKINQIYVLYSKAVKEPAGCGKGIDIRFWDNGDLLDPDVSVYFISQQDAIDTLDASLVDQSLVERDNSIIKLSFYKDVSNYEPAGATLYCSGILQHDSASLEVKRENNSLVETNKEVRIVNIKLEILDAQSGAVLASDQVTRLH